MLSAGCDQVTTLAVTTWRLSAPTRCARSIAKPFGSVAARVSGGAVTWETSLFADTKSGSYLLAIKAPVRRRAGIEAADTVTLSIALANPAG
jgi:Domain of unknown function (DUF1905)